jgi:hypothetical protein
MNSDTHGWNADPLSFLCGFVPLRELSSDCSCRKPHAKTPSGEETVRLSGGHLCSSAFICDSESFDAQAPEVHEPRMNSDTHGWNADPLSFRRVAPGGFPPGAPTDPYSHTLGHTAPQE